MAEWLKAIVSAFAVIVVKQQPATADRVGKGATKSIKGEGRPP